MKKHGVVLALVGTTVQMLTTPVEASEPLRIINNTGAFIEIYEREKTVACGTPDIRNENYGWGRHLEVVPDRGVYSYNWEEELDTDQADKPPCKVEDARKEKTHGSLI
ncbi:MAG: hypothetical protein QNJ55_25800 [Xenococcus sp. MO_188.B8]|nr:hypothetical protein [Xenococcus sp. MO_188.B8]